MAVHKLHVLKKEDRTNICFKTSDRLQYTIKRVLFSL